MTQVPQKRLVRRAKGKADLVQVTVPDHDVAYLETLARLLHANDVAAARLRGELEGILAEDADSVETMPPTVFWASTRH